MEVVSFSAAQVRALKRVFLNLLGGDLEHRVLRRGSRALGSPAAEAWLEARGWRAHAQQQLRWEGSETQAREALHELRRPAGRGGRPLTPRVPCDPQVAGRVGQLTRLEEQRGLWQWSCVLRFTPGEFVRMHKMEGVSEEEVYGALLGVVGTLQGTLTLVDRDRGVFEYVRKE